MDGDIRAVLDEVAAGTLSPEEGARRIESLGRGEAPAGSGDVEAQAEALEAQAEALEAEAEALEEAAEALEEDEEALDELVDEGDAEPSAAAERREEIIRRRKELAEQAGELSRRRRELRHAVTAARRDRRRSPRRVGIGLHGIDRLISGSIATALETVRSTLEGLGPMIEDSVRSVDVALRHAGTPGSVVVRGGPTAKEVVEAELDAREGCVVVVSSDAGSVEVRRCNGTHVRVMAEKHAPTQDDLKTMDVQMCDDVGTVRVEYRASDWPLVNRWVRFRIEAPPGCPVRVETRAGGITLDGMTAGAEARTSGGPIRASRMRGKLELNTSGGPVRVEDFEGTLDAATSGGPIDVRDAKLDGPCVLVTQGGNIRLEGAGAQSVEARTSGGNIEVSGNIAGPCVLHTSGGNIGARGIDGRLEALTSAGRITAEGRLAGPSVMRTSAGAIEVTLPADSRLRVRGRARRVSSDFDLPAEDGRLDGVIGDGGEGSLDMECQNGTIHVRRGDVQ